MSGFEEVLSGGAIGISLTGMLIVFSGLVLISLAITILPVILGYIERFAEKDKKSTVAAEVDNEDMDIASVIGLVMQMEAAQNETPEEQEEIDIANVIGLVLHLEQERCFGLPN